jgi:hypothetical protein
MKIVKVTWKDIRTLEPSWKSVEECIEEAAKVYQENFYTVGYLIHKNDDCVLVAATKGGEEYNDVSLILNSVIIDIEEL